ncbi:MAG: radical SAM protein [Aquificota bacterium]|nr:MAG: radical SAM protein [Aquificota bacterium]
MKFKYLFGPVPSRRLGLSLGVDLVPYKVCSYDCIYCEVGPTTLKTVERKKYVPLEEVKRELEAFWSLEVETDFITFSGFGEPTLHIGIGELISWIRERFPLPVAVLTNGSLLRDPQVRKELMGAHVVLPSLDAGTQEVYRVINRPHPSISFQDMVDGLEIFTRGFSGEVWLEVLLVKGVNDHPQELEALAGLVKRINPARVQLNTVVRPPAHGGEPLSLEELEALMPLFGPRAEVVAYPTDKKAKEREGLRDAIVETVARRPCSKEDIAKVLGVSALEVAKYLGELLDEGRLEAVRHGNQIFYKANRSG